MDRPNPELELAGQFVEETDLPVFLTGKAGTGKTTFLRTLLGRTGKRVAVAAPTGVAAINAGGVTLHSLFQLPFGPILPGSVLENGRHRMSREKRNLLKSLDLLVIDEISMVRADLLDGVDAVLRRYRRSEEPFGGVQLLMIGDLHQLAPVAKDQEWQLLRDLYPTPFFFSSQALRNLELVAIELLHIYRQSDARFIDLLNRVREGRLDEHSLTRLNSRHRPDFSLQEEDGWITLCTHNARADAINARRMASLPGLGRFFSAELEGSFPEYAYPTAASLELKPGAQVMFVRNDTQPEKRWYNGKIGTVIKIVGGSVRIRCAGEEELIEVAPVKWENIEYTVDPETSEITPKVVGSFSQYPLKPAWAITIHKSQGLTFDRAVIDAQAAFAPGQIYVALSRCRTFEGLVLSSPISAQTVRTDPAVLAFAKDRAEHPPDRALLERAKISYQQRLLLACYDFSTLARLFDRLIGLIRGNASIVQVASGGDLFAAHQQIREGICAVGDNFRRQLAGLFAKDKEPARDPMVAERLAKAAIYFEEKLATLLAPCLEGLSIESDNREIRKRLTEAAKRLVEEASVKRAAVAACGEGFSPAGYLRALSRAAMEHGERPVKKETIYTEADVGHPELFRQLRSWRSERAREEGVAPYQVLHQKPLIQIAVHLPETITALMEIKGIGKRLAQRYGGDIIALVANFRREHGIEQVELPQMAAAPGDAGMQSAGPRNTREQSLQLLREGRSIAEIAASRCLSPQTVEKHLAGAIREGELVLEQVLTRERIMEMEDRLAESPARSLKELKNLLGDEFSWGEATLFLAHLQHRDAP